MAGSEGARSDVDDARHKDLPFVAIADRPSSPPKPELPLQVTCALCINVPSVLRVIFRATSSRSQPTSKNMPVFNVVTNVKLDEPIVFLKELSKVSAYLGLMLQGLGTDRDRLKARL